MTESLDDLAAILQRLPASEREALLRQFLHSTGVRREVIGRQIRRLAQKKGLAHRPEPRSHGRDQPGG